MQNNLRMGFEYDIAYEDANGVIVNRQKAKNILVNEGIKNFYSAIFNIKSINNTTSLFKTFVYQFIENDYEPQPTDSLNGNNALDLYECDYNNTLINQGNYIDYYHLIVGGVTVGKDGKSVSLDEGYYKFVGYKRLTGVCIFRPNFKYDQGTFRPTSFSPLYTNKAVLLSAAKFNTPIQVMPGGTIYARGNFFLNPM